MNIVGFHFEHDGGVAHIADGRLTRLIEAQKDNNLRYSPLTATRADVALRLAEDTPNVIAIGGWWRPQRDYEGCDESFVHSQPRSEANGAAFQEFVTSHERAHIFCAYGLSPFPQGMPCYVLVWEGVIGSFLSIDSACNVVRLSTPMVEPGHRYNFLYELAHKEFDDTACGFSMGVAGKLMALASRYDATAQAELDEIIAHEPTMTHLLDRYSCHTTNKAGCKTLPLWNAGHLNPTFRRFARRFQDAIFDRFLTSAKSIVRERRPLLISGGCGLNCDWNTRWKESGLFEEVFVPPCPDDSGCAIGAAVDAQRHFTNSAKVIWSVYSGETFEHDVPLPPDMMSRPVNHAHVAAVLRDGAVVAWIHGRYEIGPRALGARSLLAAPFERATTDHLNAIKQRESYRPVAPVCIEEEAHKWFEWRGASPYMLHFQRVRSERLAAVTHDDGTARMQTVNRAQNEPLHSLLTAFGQITGVPVLCNTSLNFAGRGFINRMSDLIRFLRERRVQHAVVDGVMYELPNSGTD